MQLRFSNLMGLMMVSVLLLVPFLVSPLYLDLLRDRSFELHQFVRGEIYKQGTGFAALALVLVELFLTARKRSRSWPLKIKVPGSIFLWRAVHIFTGVALVAIVLVHTLGAAGINFNMILLFSFIGVTFTAMLGVMFETKVLESTRKKFQLSFIPGNVYADAVISKGKLIRSMRGIWLKSHIFLVSVFSLLLLVHIFLVYYFQ